MEITIQLLFAWYDFWVGFFWDRKNQKLYILPIPCIGVVLTFGRRQSSTPKIPDDPITFELIDMGDGNAFCKTKVSGVKYPPGKEQEARDLLNQTPNRQPPTREEILWMMQRFPSPMDQWVWFVPLKPRHPSELVRGLHYKLTETDYGGSYGTGGGHCYQSVHEHHLGWLPLDFKREPALRLTPEITDDGKPADPRLKEAEARVLLTKAGLYPIDQVFDLDNTCDYIADNGTHWDWKYPSTDDGTHPQAQSQTDQGPGRTDTSG